MTALTKTIVAGLALAIASVTVASASEFPVIRPLPLPHSTHPDYGIECRVHDESFYVINWGNTVLDSGLQISWQSPTTDDNGLILLPKMLAPGEELKLADVLSAVVIPGSPCGVAIV